MNGPAREAGGDGGLLGPPRPLLPASLSDLMDGPYEPDDLDYSSPTWWADPPTSIARVAKVGRNDPCPCGSGRKAKHCCGAQRGPSEEDQEPDAEKRLAEKQLLVMGEALLRIYHLTASARDDPADGLAQIRTLAEQAMRAAWTDHLNEVGEA